MIASLPSAPSSTSSITALNPSTSPSTSSSSAARFAARLAAAMSRRRCPARSLLAARLATSSSDGPWGATGATHGSCQETTGASGAWVEGEGGWRREGRG
ncbi:unnamed protein product [Closterium sp. NIES-54]